MGSAPSQQSQYNLHALVSNQSRKHIFPVEFAYDYLPGNLQHLTPSKIICEGPFYDEILKKRRTHSIPLYPSASGLPWHTSLSTLRQSKYWKINLKYTSELLRLFAEDEKLGDSQNINRQALAEFARKELDTCSYDRYTRFTTYMFPEADEKRTALLAQAILLVFVFDDRWEEAGQDNITSIQEDIVQRLQGSTLNSESETPLQKRISEIRSGFLEQDAMTGDSGADVIATLIDFFRHPPPEAEFRSIRQYLDYRQQDVALEFVVACTRFSIGSPVDIKNPKLQRIFELVGDQISIANDMASYQKEYNSFKQGKAKHLINVVEVIQRVFGFTSSDDAKAMGYALQLHTEQCIAKELERLREDTTLTILEWDLIDAVLISAAGNVFTSVAISRYGGEAARIGEKVVNAQAEAVLNGAIEVN